MWIRRLITTCINTSQLFRQPATRALLRRTIRSAYLDSLRMHHLNDWAEIARELKMSLPIVMRSLDDQIAECLANAPRVSG